MFKSHNQITQLPLNTVNHQVLRKPLSFKPISFGCFQSSKNLRLQISCAVSKKIYLNLKLNSLYEKCNMLDCNVLA